MIFIESDVIGILRCICIFWRKIAVSLKLNNPISLEVKWKVSYIPGSKMANILYP